MATRQPLMCSLLVMLNSASRRTKPVTLKGAELRLASAAAANSLYSLAMRGGGMPSGR